MSQKQGPPLPGQNDWPTHFLSGIYCRVSVDDASNSSKAKYYIPADESISIENQRELLSKFVMLNGWVETKTYVDDGYSGGNFVEVR